MTRPAAWIDITASDARRSREFYAGLFGWTFDVVEHMDYALFAASDGVRGGIGPAGGGPHPAGIVTYVVVDDVDEQLRRAAELGATVVVPRWDLPDLGSMAVVSDPDGNRIGLWTPAGAP